MTDNSLEREVAKGDGISEEKLQKIFGRASMEMYNGMRLLTADVRGHWNVDGLGGPPKIQVFNNEKEIILYEEELFDLAVNIRQYFLDEGLEYKITRR